MIFNNQLRFCSKLSRYNLDSPFSQVDDVFASLAIPLMRLVGLKKEEMDSEGRFSRVLISTDEQVAKVIQAFTVPY